MKIFCMLCTTYGCVCPQKLITQTAPAHKYPTFHTHWRHNSFNRIEIFILGPRRAKHWKALQGVFLVCHKHWQISLCQQNFNSIIFVLQSRGNQSNRTSFGILAQFGDKGSVGNNGSVCHPCWRLTSFNENGPVRESELVHFPRIP